MVKNRSIGHRIFVVCNGVLMFLICLGGAIVYIRSNMKEEVWETGK